MNYYELTGYYTYRSFLNKPEAVDDFNEIAFAEGELYLFVAPDGTISGTLAFPAVPASETKDFLDITGRVVDWSRGSVDIEGVGRAGTATELFDYKYQGSFAPTFNDGVAERPAVVGTVMRAKPHGEAPAGFTASFVAVKRDYLRPREIAQVALIPEAITMLASRRHRLQHNVWHTVRMNWQELSKNKDAVAELQKRGWWPTRPPFLDNRALDLENGAGEDFLFMHRRMIQMVRSVYQAADKPPPKSWGTLPAASVAQVVYKPSPDGKTFVPDPESSGFMVPPPVDEADQMVKSAAFLNGIMRPVQALFQSPRWLSGLTLGQLGNLLEWSIHGWMHNRWGDTVLDENGEPVGRSSLFEIDPKWDDPKNDDLFDFYSAHVHPTFWRLHGWIDDRIEAWASVHTDVKRVTIAGVPWFAADGKNVLADSPFSWPEGEHHHHGGDDQDLKAMEEAMAIMKKALEPSDSPAAKAVVSKPARIVFRDAMLGVALPELLTQ